MDKLKEQGWYLTEDGLKKLPQDVDKFDTRKIIQAALDIDFRDIACGALSSDITRKDESIAGKIVLQITKIRNISAPKANEESKTAARFLQLDLTDGVNQIQALEMEHISVLSLNVPPGTKIYLKNDKVPLLQGILMLKANDIQILGGKVPALMEKWEISRTLLKYARGGRIMSGTSGPPPWTPFGQKIQQSISNTDKNFKSLGGGSNDKDKESKENNEFDVMRSEAIAEAAKVGAKKIFGGGNQQIVDHNVKKVMEKGFSEEDAKNALKSTRNNLERALYNLKRREEYKNSRNDDYRGGSSDKLSRNSITANSGMGSGSRGGNNGGRNSGRENFSNRKSGGKDDLTTTTKPAGNVSLFDFLTDKLPANSSENIVPEKHVSNNTTTPSSSRYESSSNMKLERSARSNNNDYSNKSYYNHNSHQQQPHHHTDNRNHNNNSSGHQTISNIPNTNQTSNRSTSSGFNSTNPSATKFENNISSSFQAAANRNYSHDDRNTNNNRNSSRGGRGNNFSYRGGNDRNDDNSDRYNRNKDSQQHNIISTYSQGRNQRTNERDRNERAGSYQSSNASHYQEHNQTQGRSSGGYDSNNRNNRNDNQSHKNNYENRTSGHHSGRGGHQQSSTLYQQKDNSSNSYQHHYQQQSNNSRNYNNENSRHSSSLYHHNQQQNQNSNNSDSSKITKLIEETTKLKLDSNTNQKTANRHTMPQHQQPPTQQRNQQHHSQQQQHQPPPPPQQILTLVSHHQSHHPPQPQMQPQQIQQQHSLTHQQQQQNAYTQLPNGYTYDPNKIMGFQNKETNDFAMTLLKSQGIPTALASAGGPPQQIQLGHHPSQQQQPFATGPTFVIPQQQQSVVHQQSNHHVAAAVHQVAAAVHQVQQQQHHQQQPPPAAFGMNSGESWNWKIGDLCLAKYWDDGRYYEAEITGISDKTCVVFYLGYGNHEEVLKSDCLPVTDAQNRVINFGTTSSVQPSPIPSGALSRGVPNRYRGERQMYIPPPKREV